MKTKLFLFACIGACSSIFSSSEDAAAGPPAQTMIEQLTALVQAHPQGQPCGDIVSFKIPEAIDPHTRRRNKLLAIIAYNELDQAIQDQDGTEEAATSEEMHQMLVKLYRYGAINADNRTTPASYLQPTLLHQAARCAHSKLLEALFVLGARKSTNKTDDAGLTALGHCALRALNSEKTLDMVTAAEHCLHAGSNPHLPDEQGTTAASKFHTKLQQLTTGQHQNPELVTALQGLIRQFPAQIIMQPKETAPGRWVNAVQCVGNFVVHVAERAGTRIQQYAKGPQKLTDQRAITFHHQVDVRDNIVFVDGNGSTISNKPADDPVEITEVGSLKVSATGANPPEDPNDS